MATDLIARLQQYRIVAPLPMVGYIVLPPDVADGIIAALSASEAHTIDKMVEAHGQGQESAIADANAGRIDDMIRPRLAALTAQGETAPAPCPTCGTFYDDSHAHACSTRMRAAASPVPAASQQRRCGCDICGCGCTVPAAEGLDMKRLARETWVKAHTTFITEVNARDDAGASSDGDLAAIAIILTALRAVAEARR